MNSAKKPTTAHKNSATKSKIDKKCNTVQKNDSDKLKKMKKKIPLIEQTHLIEEDGLRGSLPGISGKKVLQKYAPMLSENQKIELINEKTVYYIGVGCGVGEDDLEGRYIWRKH
jgi:hypothetical protein